MDSQSATQTAFTDSRGLNSKASDGKGNVVLSDKQADGVESTLIERISKLDAANQQEITIHKTLIRGMR